MRLLKHHEQKLLKKVDFFSWKDDQNVREASILRKYLIQNREDYIKYNKIAGKITKLTAILLKMPIEDPIRKKVSEQLLQKLFNMGIVNKTSSLTAIEKLAVSAFCRRRLPVVMMRLKMSETLVLIFDELILNIGNINYSLQITIRKKPLHSSNKGM